MVYIRNVWGSLISEAEMHPGKKPQIENTHWIFEFKKFPTYFSYPYSILLTFYSVDENRLNCGGTLPNFSNWENKKTKQRYANMNF